MEPRDVRPLIGVTGPYVDDRATATHALPHAYVHAIYEAGGLPLHIPCLPGESVAAALLEVIHGLVLTGGVDVDPAHFGEMPLPGLGRVSPERDALELPLVRAALAADLPILAICRGAQVLNVAAGGTVYQDISTQRANSLRLKHFQDAPRWYPSHEVEVVKGSRLFELGGQARWRVNSFHHQAIRQVAPGFVVTATSPDGIIEAVEHPAASFVIGVQWHPESMFATDAGSRRLFEAFVAAARARAGFARAVRG